MPWHHRRCSWISLLIIWLPHSAVVIITTIVVIVSSLLHRRWIVRLKLHSIVVMMHGWRLPHLSTSLTGYTTLVLQVIPSSILVLIAATPHIWTILVSGMKVAEWWTPGSTSHTNLIGPFHIMWLFLVSTTSLIVIIVTVAAIITVILGWILLPAVVLLSLIAFLIVVTRITTATTSSTFILKVLAFLVLLLRNLLLVPLLIVAFIWSL